MYGVDHRQYSMTTESVHVALDTRSYDIHLHTDYAALAELLAPFVHTRTCAVITNETVGALYGATVMAALRAAGATTVMLHVPEGEQYKTLPSVQDLLEKCVAAGLDRKSLLIALGGGIIGDITGFAAAIYMRGIDFIQLPTTLLAHVDSSVGGKTGVNLMAGKNLVGVFAQPKTVYIARDTLATLPVRELRAGYAEVIKYGMLADDGLWAFLEEHTQEICESWNCTPVVVPPVVGDIIARCCARKAAIVAEDEREQGIRAILNYGHTFGHAIERLASYGTYVHGEAVAIGMHAAAVLAEKLGMCDADVVARQRALITAAGLSVTMPALPIDDILEAFYHDKKTRGATLRFILPTHIGGVACVENPDPACLRATLEACQKAE